MKYETFIKAIYRYIEKEARGLESYAAARDREEQNVKNASFINAMNHILWNMGSHAYYAAGMQRIREAAEYLNASKSFVERQPAGMTFFQIGEAWKRRKDQR